MLPEDRYVNVYHWVRLDNISDFADAVAPAMEDLYTGLQGFGPAYIQSAAEVRVYDLADPEPRAPEIRFIDIGTGGSTATLPFEVAVVVSLRGAPPVTPRRRGRLYLGPFGTAAVTAGTTTDEPKVNPGVVDAIAALFTNLFNAPGLAGWSIRSTVPSENFVEIVDGFIDNEFDTQRRRGHTADLRVFWPVP